MAGLGQHPRAAARAERVFLPAEHALHQIAGLEARGLRADDLTYGAAGHHVADGDRRRVGLRRAHPPPHVGVEGEIEYPHQRLAGPGLGHGFFRQRESRFAFGMPAGRAASLIWRLVTAFIAVAPLV